MPAPQACAVSKQNPTRSGAIASGRDRRGDARELVDAGPEARRRCPPSSRGRAWPARRHDGAPSVGGRRVRRRRARPHRRRVDRLQGAQDAVREPFDARRDAATQVRADVDVDEARPERRRLAQLVGEHVDRALERLRIRAGEVHEVRGVDRDRRDVELAQASRNAASSGGGSARRFQAVGLSREDLHRARPDLVGAVDRLDHPGREGQVRTESSAIGEHRTHRTMAPMDADAAPRTPPSRRGSSGRSSATAG